MPASETHVVAAVITNAENQVLISLRAPDAHMGNLWEFPGGKVEAGETAFEALQRELDEELGIRLNTAQPFKQIQYDYPDKTVRLDVWKVETFEGEPRGIEGQQIQWQPIHRLKPEQFPAANKLIIKALQLSDKYMITGSFENPEQFISQLENCLIKGISLVQLRSKNIGDQAFMQLAEQASALCSKQNAILLLNTRPEMFRQLDADGLHLSSQQLYSVSQRPVDSQTLLSVSCHTEQDIDQAEQLAADIILLSPVKETTSHPGVPGIGWQQFSRLAARTSTPIYALGGMTAEDMEDAKAAGAQGVAAISAFWSV